MAETKLEEILRLRRAPGLSGLSDGRGSGIHEMVFDRPYPKRDVLHGLKQMEESGQLNTPAARQAAKVKWDAVKDAPDPRIDYQKTGHPIERSDSGGDG